MDAIEVKVNVNQRRQTRWLKDYHESYRKKLEERKNAVISETEKEKNELRRKSQRDRVSCTAEKVALVISA